MPFAVPFIGANFGHCAVSNGNYSYVIGVGDQEDEIWVNSNSRNESAWQKVGKMYQGRKHHACLWYDSNIMITGGHVFRSDVEIFNTETNSVWESTSMLRRRGGHAMILYDGYPTVVGGRNGMNILEDLESYDIGTGQWFTQERRLKIAKDSFGIVEIEPLLGVRGDGQC